MTSDEKADYKKPSSVKSERRVRDTAEPVLRSSRVSKTSTEHQQQPPR